MSSYQRRRGQFVNVYPVTTQKDARGNEHVVADMDNPIQVRAVFVPTRSAVAEVPGQQQIDVTRMIVRHDVPNVDMWSKVEWQGYLWDVVAPPSYHHGTRQTRHYTLDIRRRPTEADA